MQTFRSFLTLEVVLLFSHERSCLQTRFFCCVSILHCAPHCLDDIKTNLCLARGHSNVSHPLSCCVPWISHFSLSHSPFLPHQRWHLGPVQSPSIGSAPPPQCVLCLGALTFLLLGVCFSSLLLQKIYMLTRDDSRIWHPGLSLRSSEWGHLIIIILPKVKFMHFIQFEMNLVSQDEMDFIYK